MSFDPDIIDAQWRPIDGRASKRTGPPFQAVGSADGVQAGNVPPRARRTAAPGSEFPRDSILGERWPTLAAAMNRYEQNVAEEFAREAYHRVSAGIIRHDARKGLGARAAELKIRPFDAQLLIACALRKWSEDQGTVAKPSCAPLSAGAPSCWRRLGVLVALAGILDAILIWRMNH
jgi:hypothetical protein